MPNNEVLWGISLFGVFFDHPHQGDAMTAIQDTAGSQLPAEEVSTLTEKHRIIFCEDAGIAYCECETGEVTLEENGLYECSQYRLTKCLVSG